MPIKPGGRGQNTGESVLFLATLLFFFVSGACGLLYQVVWTRKLVLLFGTTSYAVSTVLSIFFLGFGAGSLWGGRIADRTRRPLMIYGMFEILIGLWALVFIFLVGAGEEGVAFVLRAAGASRGLGILLRSLLSLAFLIVPVTLMGATLPLLAKFVGSQAKRRGWRIGALYSLNTFGAVAGCALTGFVLLAHYGYTRTTLIGAAANVLVGVLAVMLCRSGKASRETPPETGPVLADAPGTAAEHPWITRLVVVTFALSGCCALALEVIWTRMLAIVFLGTTYAFTTMLTSLLCGIAAGSAFASAIVDRRRHPIALFGSVEILIGLSCLFLLAGFAWLPDKLAELHRDVGYDWTRTVYVKFLLSFTVLFVPTFFFGMTFPVVVRAATASGSRLGRDVGRLYSANTFGGVVGAVLGGYVLIPLLGVHVGAVALSCVLLAAGVVLVLACPTLGRLGKGSVLAVVILAVCAALPRAASVAAPVLADTLGGYYMLMTTPTGTVIVALAVFVAGAAALFALPTLHVLRKAGVLALAAAGLVAAWVFLPDDAGHALTRGYIPPNHEELFYREGVEGTVVVVQPENDASGSNRVLYINGVQATASIEKGVKMNRLQGVMPLLFDRDPRDVLFMCFGSGITAGTLGLYDFDRIDAVEIAPDVLEAAPLFEKDNLGIINNPKVNFVVDDGRNFLLTTPNRYDLITFEPMPLALAGVSTFYTQEYYELCRARLKPGGMVSQWIPLHSLSPEVVKALALTFRSAFPEYCAWFVNADLFFVGSDQPLRIDYVQAERRLSNPVIQGALAEVGFTDLPELLTCFFMGKDHVDQFAQGRIMSDDLPWAEFEAPKLVYAREVAPSLRELAPLYESPLNTMILNGLQNEAEVRDAIDRRYRARIHDLSGVEQYYGGMVGGDQEAHFKKALSIDPADETARYYLRQVAVQRVAKFLAWKDLPIGDAYLTDILEYLPGNAELTLMLADIQYDLGRPYQARENYRKYLELGGTEPRARERAGSSFEPPIQ